MGHFSDLNLRIAESDGAHWAWQNRMERRRQRHAPAHPNFAQRFTECAGCGHVTRWADGEPDTCGTCGERL